MYDIRILRAYFREVTEWRAISLRHFWRLYYNPTPGAEINGIKLDEKNIIAIPPGVTAKQVLINPFSHLFIHFTAEYPFDRGDKIIQMPANDHCLEIINLILEERNRNQLESKFPLEHTTLMRVISLIATLLSHLKVENNEFKDVRVIKAIRVLEKNLDSNLSNERLAKEASMSANGFARLFKENTGFSPHQFILKKKLSKSAALLSDTSKSIEEISDICGFCNRTYFSRLFKREYNVGPGQYRREVIL
ncbi:MAG: AraC family transcriptional regulator [Lentisphaeraceae bacterium]|nr:AraC family transcriptional regulator [Lentisphaeraceae bacterium]